MTPAIRAARAAGVAVRVHEYAHDPGNRNFGLEAAEALGLDPQRVFKTLLVALNGDPRRLAVAVVPVSGQLDLKAMAVACGAKKVELADPAVAERATGYVVGHQSARPEAPAADRGRCQRRPLRNGVRQRRTARPGYRTRSR